MIIVITIVIIIICLLLLSSLLFFGKHNATEHFTGWLMACQLKYARKTRKTIDELV